MIYHNQVVLVAHWIIAHYSSNLTKKIYPTVFRFLMFYLRQAVGAVKIWFATDTFSEAELLRSRSRTLAGTVLPLTPRPCPLSTVRANHSSSNEYHGLNQGRGVA